MAPRNIAKSRGAGQPSWQLSPQSLQVSYAAMNSGDGWFSPLNPLKPVAPVSVTGRQFDFASGYNISTQPRSYEAIGFPMLRALADGYDLLRTVIETRKDQIERMSWSIRVKKSKKAVRQDARTDKIEAFFQSPDGFNTWAAWLRLLLEDMFVLDAPAIFVQKSIGGDLLSLHAIDGGTIKRVIDELGRTPTAPVPELDAAGKPTGAMVAPAAYQQVLKGMPAVNYTAEELIYRPRNPRTNKVYGYSPVEQIIMTVNIALRRQLFTLNYYTEGNIPEALVGVPDTWTPAQIAEYQTYFDQIMSGDLAARRKLKFIPSGVGKTIVQTKEIDQKNEFDEWLARICCFAFSVSPTPFIKQMNRATAGTQKEQSDQEGLAPVLMWVKSLIDGIIARELKSPDIEFVWGEDTQIDPVDEEAVLSGYTKTGILTLNQSRERLGEDPYSDPAADIPMVLTATGYVPLSAYQDAQDKAASDAKTAADALKAGNLDANGKPVAGSNDPNAGNSVPDDASAVSADAGNAAEKHTHSHALSLPFNKRRYRKVAAIPFDRAPIRAAVGSMSHRLGIALGKWAKSAAKQAKAALTELGKNTDDDNRIAANIAAELTFDGLVSLAHDLGVDLSDVASDSVNEVIAQLGVTDASDLVNQVNDRAVAAARERAAEMVGMRVNEDGSLEPNPDAEWVITDTMRDDIRSTIESGLADNIGLDEIADNIEALGGFSAERAALIANTEVARANSSAALDSYISARDELGINSKKAWLLGPNPCPICEANAAQGPIDLGDEFESGDDAPPAHPYCECVLVPVVEEDATSGAVDDAELSE